MASEDNNARTAVRKLRQRCYNATNITKKKILAIQSKPAAEVIETATAEASGGEAVGKLKKRLQ